MISSTTIRLGTSRPSHLSRGRGAVLLGRSSVAAVYRQHHEPTIVGYGASQEREEFCYEHCGDKVNVGPIHGGVAFGYVVLGAVVTVLVMVIGSFCLGQLYGALPADGVSEGRAP